MADDTLSLCICTRNRPQDISRCLEAVATGDRLPDQVIVSDDGDEGKTVEAIAAKFPFVHYQRGPRVGLGANRNACIAVATGRFLSFIDDDVFIPHAYVTEALALCAKYHGERPAPIITGIEHKHVSKDVYCISPGNADFWGYQHVEPNGIYRAVVINATVFPASLFESALFDAKLKYGSEEIDMARHAVSLGYRIVFEPSLEVDHHPSEINRGEYASLIEASRLYATTKSYLYYEKKPLKALTYALLAPPKLALAGARRWGWKGVSGTVASTRTALQYLQKEADSRKA